MKNSEFLRELEKKGYELKQNEKMSAHTSFKIGGAADFYIYPSSSDELVKLIKLCKEFDVPFFVIGKGSNLLVSDLGIEGAVIDTSKLNAIKQKSENVIFCECGASLMRLCIFALEAGLSGLEFAFGIPGSVGGATVMNAGAYGGEISDVIKSCFCIDRDGNALTLLKKDMALGYRTSVFKEKGLIVLSAEFELSMGDKSEIKEKMNGFMERRKQKQPLEFPSAGSTFKRPEGYFAGALIEKNGFKGKMCGGAQVSEKHAGFIINKDNANAEDIKNLINDIKETVLKNDNVLLEPEVIFIGRKEEG